jgi:Inovirus Coat protein B
MVTTITTALSGLEADLLSVAGVGLGVGVAIFALRKGYSLVKSFI